MKENTESVVVTVLCSFMSMKYRYLREMAFLCNTASLRQSGFPFRCLSGLMAFCFLNVLLAQKLCCRRVFKMSGKHGKKHVATP